MNISITKEQTERTLEKNAEMSTYRGRGVNRGGRGRRGCGGRLSTLKPVNRTKMITAYNYYVGSTQQAIYYEITTEFIINHI